MQAQLAKFTGVKTALSLEDWCSCFSRCPDLLSVSPQVLSERLSKLKSCMAVDDASLVGTVTKAPSLLQHSPGDIAEKVCAEVQLCPSSCVTILHTTLAAVLGHSRASACDTWIAVCALLRMLQQMDSTKMAATD